MTDRNQAPHRNSNTKPDDKLLADTIARGPQWRARVNALAERARQPDNNRWDAIAIDEACEVLRGELNAEMGDTLTSRQWQGIMDKTVQKIPQSGATSTSQAGPSQTRQPVQSQAAQGNTQGPAQRSVSFASSPPRRSEAVYYTAPTYSPPSPPRMPSPVQRPRRNSYGSVYDEPRQYQQQPYPYRGNSQPSGSLYDRAQEYEPRQYQRQNLSNGLSARPRRNSFDQDRLYGGQYGYPQSPALSTPLRNIGRPAGPGNYSNIGPAFVDPNMPYYGQAGRQVSRYPSSLSRAPQSMAARHPLNAYSAYNPQDPRVLPAIAREQLIARRISENSEPYGGADLMREWRRSARSSRSARRGFW